MLLLGSRLFNAPILSLQTGTRLAFTKYPVINPEDLKIIAYEVEGPMVKDSPSFIRIADVRELSDIGLIIDSSDEIISTGDVLLVDKLYGLNFKLIGLSVIDETKRKLGKVEDFSVDTDSFIIQQLHVKQSILKILTETNLLVHRSQIVEINNDSIIVKTTAKKLNPIENTEKLSYLNPFRTT